MALRFESSVTLISSPKMSPSPTFASETIFDSSASRAGHACKTATTTRPPARERYRLVADGARPSRSVICFTPKTLSFSFDRSRRPSVRRDTMKYRQHGNMFYCGMVLDTVPDTVSCRVDNTFLSRRVVPVCESDLNRTRETSKRGSERDGSSTSDGRTGRYRVTGDGLSVVKMSPGFPPKNGEDSNSVSVEPKNRSITVKYSKTFSTSSKKRHGTRLRDFVKNSKRSLDRLRSSTTTVRRNRCLIFSKSKRRYCF